MKTNKKWLELRTLQRQVAYDTTNGASEQVLAQLGRKITTLKADIHREALGQQDEVQNVQLNNKRVMVGLMLKYNITISGKTFATWRPTKLSTGTIEGLEHLGELLIVATDGLQAYYLQRNQNVFFGHIQFFTGDVEPLFSKPNEQPIKRKKRLTLVDRALELLKEKK